MSEELEEPIQAAFEAEDAVSQITRSSEVYLDIPHLDEVKQLSHESIVPQNSYKIKPNFQDIFKEVPVNEIIRNVQFNILTGKTYDAESAKRWTIKIANEITEKVKDIEMKRYRHIVQVIMGERKGQGVKSGLRCVWDTETDGFCSEMFLNDTIFCVVVVYAVFLY